MIKPKLTDFTDFVEKPKPVIFKTRYQIQQGINFYMNIALFLIILLGGLVLFYRGKGKSEREKKAKHKLSELESYMNDYIIHNMLKQ